MRVLVTGANGFVGSHLVDELLARDHGVVALVRPTADRSHLPDRPGLEVVEGRLARGELPEAALEDVDTVFHAAAALAARRWEDFRRVNVEATLALYRRFARRPTARRFVFVSSLAAAGPAPAEAPRGEADPPAPTSDYGRSKLQAEVGLDALEGPPLTVVRPPAVYGPRDVATLPLFRLARRGVAVQPGRRERRVSLLQVEDLARGLVDAAGAEAGVGTFFLSDGGYHTWGEVGRAMAPGARVVRLPEWLVRGVGALSEGLGRLTGSHPVFDRAKAADFLAPGWCCRIDAARAAFGYAPRWNLTEGMARTAAWYKEQGWL